MHELKEVRSDPQGYAREHYTQYDPEYDILMSHTSCSNLNFNQELSYTWLAYVNEAGPCGTDDEATTPLNFTLMDYFLTNFDAWGYSTFGMLYGSYYLQDPHNIVSAIITQMGDQYLFNCYYDQMGIGCSCSSENHLTCAYIISSQLTPNPDILTEQWMPMYEIDECSLLCPYDD